MSEPCDHPGCSRTDAAPCAYVDRKARPCGYSWCPDHSAPLNKVNYCRRHGGVTRAIAENPYDTIEPPDLDNRALSLCEWVSADLDEQVRAMLAQLQKPNDGSVITLHPLRLVIQRQPHRRGWARVWTLSTQTGVVKKLGVEVDEARDAEVMATVDGNTVASEVPPWIGDRGTQIAEDASKRKRAKFREDLLEAMNTAVVAARSWG
ncbi:MAG TPA: hypothetical protein VIN56_01670 [Candidatus Dormibacteraeota bacterium]|jgi:hypothetical protein